MSSISHDGEEELDRATTAAIRHAIGQRLWRDIGPEDASLPSGLQALLNEMRRQDENGH